MDIDDDDNAFEAVRWDSKGPRVLDDVEWHRKTKREQENRKHEPWDLFASASTNGEFMNW